MRCSAKKKEMYIFIERLAALFCDKIICISDAEKQGKQIFEQARADARAAVKEMEVQVAQKSTAAAEKIAEATEASCQRLRTEAETKMDAAVGIIVGRIVNGA